MMSPPESAVAVEGLQPDTPLQTREREYGSDSIGLICGYLFAGSAAGRHISTAEALAWLGLPEDQRVDQFIWLHFNLSNVLAEKWMRSHLRLADGFFGALDDESRSTRIDNAEDSLVAVINDVAYDFAFEPSAISTLWLSVQEQIMVSARVRPLRSIDRLRLAVKQGREFESAMSLLIHLMHDQGDELQQIVRKATIQVDDIEDSLLAGRSRRNRADLGQLRRVFVRLQRLLAPEPAALFRLLQHPPRWISADDLAGMRQATEEFSLVLRDVAALQERIRLLQEEVAARVSEHTSQSLFILTVVTVLALPLNIVAGLMGMNVGGIPMAEDAHGFAKVVLLLVLAAAIIGWAAWRRLRD